MFLLSSFCHQSLRASEPGSAVAAIAANDVDSYISGVYDGIDFGKDGDKLNPEVFKLAMKGYLNLKDAGKLGGDKQILTVVDFTRSSNQNRMWIIDLKANKVLMHTYVAHGQGSGDEFATAFSNLENSHQSSLGFYVTGDTYIGEHGTSLRLNGMDNGYNNAAFDRGIVVHGADYVCKDFIAGNQRLGRSWGCPAVNSKLAPGIINTIKGGTCLFLYYPQKTYLKTAYWVNKKVENVPASRNIAMLPAAAPVKLATAIKRDTVTVYMQPANHL